MLVIANQCIWTTSGRADVCVSSLRWGPRVAVADNRTLLVQKIKRKSLRLSSKTRRKVCKTRRKAGRTTESVCGFWCMTLRMAVGMSTAVTHTQFLRRLPIPYSGSLALHTSPDSRFVLQFWSLLWYILNGNSSLWERGPLSLMFCSYVQPYQILQRRLCILS